MEMSLFFSHNIAEGSGGRRDVPKADQKIVVRSRFLCNNYLEGFFTPFQVLLTSIVGKQYVRAAYPKLQFKSFLSPEVHLVYCFNVFSYRRNTVLSY